MRMYDLILKKRQGKPLTKDEIQWMIREYTDGRIPDYQMSALLMAICFQGLDKEETYELTMAMARSGEMLDLSQIQGIKVDKHSTGGVGDKTSLALTPIVASLGIPVAKMSGRGLGHTGGTIDKLESIPGFSTQLEDDAFEEQVNSIGISIMGQTKDLAPADKLLYALRDVTATVDQISLIASSIMSKKLAAGADAILLDVKTGSGAFMKEESDAMQLAKEMVEIGKSAGRKMTAVITNMDEPLGNDEILKLNILLNSFLQGLTLNDINIELVHTMKVQAGMHADILEGVFNGIVEAIHEADNLEIYTSGATNMLKYPELSNPEHTTALLDTLVEKKQLVKLVDDTVNQEEKHGIQVYIGNETQVQSLRDCSIVTATYELKEGGTGTVGIIGPKRMDYRKVVNTLRNLTDDLDEIFNNKS